MKLEINEEISRVAAVLLNRGVNVDRMMVQMSQDKIKPEDKLKTLVGTLYDGLAYGNWPT